MKKIWSQFKTIKWQILFRVFIASFVALSSISILTYVFTKNIISSEIESKMNGKANVVRHKIQNTITEYSTLSRSISAFVETAQNKFSRNEYLNMIEHQLEKSSDIFGGGIWFEPYTYSKSQQYFGPYVYWDIDRFVRTREYEDPDFNFHFRSWYKMSKNAQGAVSWSLPFYNEVTNTTMITCAAPFFDKRKRFLGTSTIDIDIEKIQKYIGNLKIGDTGYVSLFVENGLCIAHPNEKLVTKATLQNFPNESFRNFAVDILSKSQGQGQYESDGVKYCSYFSTIEPVNWKMVVSISENELYASLNMLFYIISILSFVAMVFLLVLGYFFTIKLSGPIVNLAMRVKRFASGNMVVPSVSNKKNVDISIEDEKNEIIQIIVSFRNIVNKFIEIISIASSSNFTEIAKKNSDFARGFSGNSQNQAATMENINVAVNQISLGVKNISGIIETQSLQLNSVTDEIKEFAKGFGLIGSIIDDTISKFMEISKEANSGQKSVSLIGDFMVSISQTLRDVSNIVDTIISNAEQMNLLALNGAIEAARAGDAGKGFAVIVDEISMLADQTSSNINEISSLIKTNQNEVNNGIAGTDETVKNIIYIIDGVNSIVTMMNEVQSIIQERVNMGDKVGTEVLSLKEQYNQVGIIVGEQIQEIGKILNDTSLISEYINQNAGEATKLAYESSSMLEVAQKFKDSVDYFKITKAK